MSKELDGISKEFISRLINKEDELIRSSIRDLVERGILIVEKMPYEYKLDGYTLTSKSGMRVVVKDMEYIEKLEKELKYYRSKVVTNEASS